jgi:hypothetical protein
MEGNVWARASTPMRVAIVIGVVFVAVGLVVDVVKGILSFVRP